MKNYSSLKEHKKRLLSDPKVKKAYDGLELEYMLILSVIEKRIRQNISQKELAQKVGTQQSAISRFESGNANPSLAFLKKIAYALDASLEIKLHPLR